MRDADGARHHPLQRLGDAQHAAEVVVAHHRVARLDAALLSILRVHEHRVPERLLRPRHVVVAGVRAAHVMRRVRLQRIGALHLGVPVGERVLVAAIGHEVVRVGLDGLGVVVAVADVVAPVVGRTAHHVRAVGHELVERDLALLFRVVRMVLPVVIGRPGDHRLPTGEVFGQLAHPQEVAQPLVVVALGIGVVRVEAHALDDVAADALLLARLVHRLHQRAPSQKRVLALLLPVAVAEGARPAELAPALVVVALPVGGHRQDDVGERGGQ